MTKMGINQFNNPKPLEAFDAYLLRGKYAGEMREIHGYFERSPNICLFHSDLDVFWMRHEGKRRKFTPRQMVYFIATGTAPPLGKTTCGTTGCMNPAHQTIISKRVDA